MSEQTPLSRWMDIIFICSSIIFNVAVSLVYISSKLSNMALLLASGYTVILLIIPFTISLIGHLKEKAEIKRILTHVIILFYLFLELVLDHILRFPFREVLVPHILYIIVFYIAAFNMLFVSYQKDKNLGIGVIITFVILIGCLIFYLV
ncbi:MAG: hypothetical protein ACFFCO_10085 [Promethearchaeota archaeon]